MDIKRFDSYEDLALSFIEQSEDINDNNTFSEVAIIAKYEEMRKIICELVKYDVALGEIELFEDYEYEYYLSLLFDDEYDVKYLYCDKFKGDKGYYNNQPDIAFVMENCSSACLNALSEGVVVEVRVGEDDEDGECCMKHNLDSYYSESHYVSKDENGKLLGISKTWHNTIGDMSYTTSISHYSDDIDELRDLAEEFGIKL